MPKKETFEEFRVFIETALSQLPSFSTSIDVDLHLERMQITPFLISNPSNPHTKTTKKLTIVPKNGIITPQNQKKSFYKLSRNYRITKLSCDDKMLLKSYLAIVKKRVKQRCHIDVIGGWLGHSEGVIVSNCNRYRPRRNCRLNRLSRHNLRGIYSPLSKQNAVGNIV